MKDYKKNICLFILLIVLATVLGCESTNVGGVERDKKINIGGVGWDEEKDIQEAKNYPTTQSDRILVSIEEVEYGTFKQEFDVFQDFTLSGNVTNSSSDNIKTPFNGTAYSISDKNNVLKIWRNDVQLVERKLLKVFHMRPINAGFMPGKSQAEDIILCRTTSRSTTGLHYILIVNGNGEILFEKIMEAGEDWDILPGKDGEIVIGGARFKTIISRRK